MFSSGQKVGKVLPAVNWKVEGIPNFREETESKLLLLLFNINKMVDSIIPSLKLICISKVVSNTIYSMEIWTICKWTLEL